MKNYREDVVNSLRKKAKIFLIISIAVFASGIVTMTTILTGMQTGEEVANTPIGAAIAVVTTTTIASAILMVFFLLNRKKSNDEKYITNEIERLERLEQEQKQKEEKKKAEIEKISPDFETTKTFKSGNSCIWINQLTKQIQFLLPEVEKNVPVSKIVDFFFGKAKTFKTKILSLDDLKDVEIEEEVVVKERVSGTGGRLSSERSGIGGLSGTITTQTIKYYTLKFMFEDIDNPVVRIYFSNDKATPELCRETVLLIIEKK